MSVTFFGFGYFLQKGDDNALSDRRQMGALPNLEAPHCATNDL
jgi:hypothetical protein